MEILMYFLKSAACLALFMLFYRLLLEKENMHVFKRFYLLFAVVISLIIPFITFTTFVEALPKQISYIAEVSAQAPTGKVPEHNINYWHYLFWVFYGLGILFFSTVFISNLRELFLKINRNPKQESNGFTNVLLEEVVTPHTFWNYIFLNKKKFIEGSIPQEVFVHEQAHAKQKHSIDILFMELLQVVLWFYPLIYLVKNAIKLNHEFLADKAVLQKGANTTNYQETLLEFSSNATSSSSFVNAISYSSMKKRFTVMKTKTSRSSILIRSILILPLLAALVYGFSTREEVQKHLTEIKSTTANTVQEEENQRKATSEMLREYDSLVKHYNGFGDHAFVKLRDWDRMEYIYSLLTSEQKEKVAQRKFETVPPPIPAQWAKEKKATPEMIEEYNKLVSKYRSQPQKTDKSKVFEYEFLRMKHIHGLMTEDQQKNSKPLPDILSLPQPTSTSIPDDKNQVNIEDFNIHILKNGNFLMNHKEINLNGLEKIYSNINISLLPELQKNGVEVWVESEVSVEQVQKVEDILRSFGLSQINITFKALTDVPIRDYPDYPKKIKISYPDGMF